MSRLVLIILVLLLLIVGCNNGDVKLAKEYNHKSVIAFENENYNETIKLATKALKLYKKESYYFNRANAYYHTDKYDEAIEDFTKAIEVYKNSDEFLIKHYNIILYARALAYQKSKQHMNAINDFSEYILNDSLNANIYFSRANSFSLIDSFSLAIQDYDKSLLLNYNNKNLCVFRSPILFFLGKYDEALDDLNTALDDEEITSENNYLLFGRGATLIELKNYQKAKLDIENYIENKSDDAIGNLLMGIIQYRLNNFAVADFYYSKADSLRSPEDKDWNLIDTYIYYSTNIKSILKEWGKI